jgi:DNA-binding response OmpR family regulator
MSSNPEPTGAQILIVDDHLPFARAIGRWLAVRGYGFATAGTIAEFRRVFDRRGADLVLLDLNLGAEDGLVLADELGECSGVGVIIMSGRDEVRDRVRGLDAGADDYLVKPFAMEELGARVRAVLRRRPRPPVHERPVQLGPVRLDPLRNELHCEGLPAVVQLTEREGAILRRLMGAAGRPLARSELLPGRHWEPGDRSVDVHVGRIRRKLAAAGIRTLAIAAVRGRGYRLDQLIRTGGAASASSVRHS